MLENQDEKHYFHLKLFIIITIMFINDLRNVNNAALVGGKAWNLAKVLQTGFRIPETKVINIDALNLFVSFHNLKHKIEDHLAVNYKDSKSISESYKSITELILSSDIPVGLRQEFEPVFEKMLADSTFGLAVRSSAVHEDSTETSFAGVFDSFINVISMEDIWEKIKSCWLSSWSPKALRYMSKMGIKPVITGMAVILQEVIPAECSGVIYTADPLTGNPWEFVINAVPGLSIDLLSGSGKGDFFRTGWETGKIIESEIIQKHEYLKASENGLSRVEIKKDSVDKPVLDDYMISYLANTARKLDEKYNKRLDIEWVWINRELYIIQLRPLTAVPVFFPVNLDHEQNKRSWGPALTTLPLRADQHPNLLTPLYSDYSEAEMWHRYQPEDIILTSICSYTLDVNGYRYWDTDKQPNFMEFFDHPGEYESWILKNEPEYRERWDKRKDELQEIKDIAVNAIENNEHSFELIPSMLEVMDRLWDLNSFGWSGPQALGWMCEAALDSYLNENNIKADIYSLIFGGNNSYTYRVSEALYDLGKTTDEKEVLSVFNNLPLNEIIPHLNISFKDSAFIIKLESLCWKFGKTPPSWIDRPSFWNKGSFDIQIVNAIKKSMQNKSRDVRELQNKSQKNRLEYVKSIRENLKNSKSCDLERFDRLVELARYWGQALNDRHGLAVGLLYEKELIWYTGCRLKSEGLLNDVEDILVMKRSDLEKIKKGTDLESLKDIYLNRLHEFMKNRRLTPPIMPGSQKAKEIQKPVIPEKSSKPGAIEQTYKGKGFSGGFVSGNARKIENLFDEEELDSLYENDILILPYETAFHYADWHSLLTVIKAVVSPGRPSHHLAQVARECCVPLVGHVSGDLNKIPEGISITVDGTKGLIRVVS